MKRRIMLSLDGSKTGYNNVCSHIVRIILINFLICSCTVFGSKREDHGSFNYNRKRSRVKMIAPLGMVVIPSGSFMRGGVDQDIVNQGQENRRITVSEFFMHETEVTNAQYRQFMEILKERAENLSNDLNKDIEQESMSTASTTDPDSDDEPLNEFDARLSLEVKQNPDFIESLRPDPDVWHKDFEHTMADTYLEYYDSPAFDDYPVVGITWDNANLFAEFQTLYLNEYRTEKGLPPYPSFVLPSAAQWEYAARGGKELAKYPWGGPYVRDAKGKLLANFKSASGNYCECGYSYTSPVKAFLPNDYGLYDMAGNVAEWTRDARNPISIRKTWDLDPIYEDNDEPMKVIKGGSWKDISRFLQTGSEDYEHKDIPRSFIGFRLVMPSIGQ